MNTETLDHVRSIMRHDNACDQIVPSDLRDLVGEIDRLKRIEAAARHVAETLNGGFIRCNTCGEQEATTDIDFADELYEALGITPEKA